MSHYSHITSHFSRLSFSGSLPGGRKYFQELQIQTVTPLFYFPITAFCHPHCWKGRPNRQFSIYYTRITILWSPIISVAAVAFTVPIFNPRFLIYVTRSHYSERASALDFKDATTLRFGYSDVVFDLLIETRFSHFNHPLVQVFKTFSAF